MVRQHEPRESHEAGRAHASTPFSHKPLARATRGPARPARRAVEKMQSEPQYDLIRIWFSAERLSPTLLTRMAALAPAGQRFWQIPQPMQSLGSR